MVSLFIRLRALDIYNPVHRPLLLVLPLELTFLLGLKSRISTPAFIFVPPEID